jgi:formamidopyrimidine-DNA glycosylase
MPELPDLQVFSRNLDKALSGKLLLNLSVLHQRKLKVPESEMKSAVEKSVLTKVYREGKELHFQFENGSVLGMHLMLKGELFLYKKEVLQKKIITELLFEDATRLALTDYQGSATLTLNPEKRDTPDALSKAVNFRFLREKMQRSRSNIKKLLLDQHFIRGIGNAYADEILWAARISPLSACNKVPDEKIKVLASSIKSVLKNAEKQILKVDPDIISGEVRDFLKIHNSKKKKSPGGAIIQTAMINSRKTYYTDEQELFK